MELTCIEKVERTAEKDSVIFGDDRVVHNLLNDEMFTTPQCDYFQEVQDDIQPFMRKVVTTWMMEVCEEQMCEDQVLPLAINYMDRFLSVCKIKRQQLQLLGATCLLIASKIRCTNNLTINLLCAYTDYSITYDHVVSWELLVLSKLKWNMSAVTGFDYVDHVISRHSWGEESSLLRRHAHTLVSICYIEPGLIQTPPSVISAACIVSAIRGLKLFSRNAAVHDVCKMLNVSLETVEMLVNLIDAAVSKAVPSSPQKVESKTVPGYESPQYGQPETPTEVENIYF